MTDELRDIFMCHASEDKAEIVGPIIEAFGQAGITHWYDEAEIKWGDSITQKVNEGLTVSRYVIVVFSPAFIGKNWPERELNAVLNIEASIGKVKVLPLLVGSKRDKDNIISRYPLINDKRYLPWDGDIRNIVDAMLVRLGRKTEYDESGRDRINPPVGIRIPLPKIRKQFTQRDKDIFLKDAFIEIKQYFRRALLELEKNYHEVDTDFSEVHNFKFVSTIYIKGEAANRCKIWLGGGMTSSDSIAYQSGQFSIESDNSYNDILSVEDDEKSLGLRPMMSAFHSQRYPEKSLLNIQEAAEYLWRGFTDTLG
jgi:hypothetical protein